MRANLVLFSRQIYIIGQYFKVLEFTLNYNNLVHITMVKIVSIRLIIYNLEVKKGKPVNLKTLFV